VVDRGSKKKEEGIEEALEEIVLPETAGDPMSTLKWVRSSLRELARRLDEVGYGISAPTVGRLLRKNDYSLRANVKKIEGSNHPDRNKQFEYIEQQKLLFSALGLPIISVDSKKKELIGNFKNTGLSWCKQPEFVSVYDFPQDALGRAIPYGIYDVNRNRGHVYIGNSADTPEFAVDAIASWWRKEGIKAYPQADQLLILADSGGSNSCRFRAWKQNLQETMSDRQGVAVNVCHYPTGCSKWNPIEHRMFSFISGNWSGKPLRSFEIMLSCVRGTSTNTGLQVEAFMLEGDYKKGKSVTDEEMEQLNIQPHAVCPTWNYSFKPRIYDRPSLRKI